MHPVYISEYNSNLEKKTYSFNDLKYRWTGSYTEGQQQRWHYLAVNKLQ